MYNSLLRQYEVMLNASFPVSIMAEKYSVNDKGMLNFYVLEENNKERTIATFSPGWLSVIETKFNKTGNEEAEAEAEAEADRDVKYWSSF